MAGKGGLLGEEHSIIDDASQDSVTKWEEKYVAPGGEASSCWGGLRVMESRVELPQEMRLILLARTQG